MNSEHGAGSSGRAASLTGPAEFNTFQMSALKNEKRET